MVAMLLTLARKNDNSVWACMIFVVAVAGIWFIAAELFKWWREFQWRKRAKTWERVAPVKKCDDVIAELKRLRSISKAELDRTLPRSPLKDPGSVSIDHLIPRPKWPRKKMRRRR